MRTKQNDILIVEDATKDERFCDHSMVTGGLAIRFYAGVPIISAGGYKLGTVCIIDNRPQALSADAAKVLQVISRQVSKLLELRLKNKLLRQKAEEQLHLEKWLLQKALQEHEAEKLSISTELHENIAQTLAATRFYLEMAEGEQTINTNLFSKIRENLTTLVGQVRALSHSISPLLLKEVELKALLIGLLDQFQKNSGITGELIFEGKREVSSSLALTVYRVVETQLKNVQQHARATHVVINIHVFSTIYLSIKDNGIGFESPSFQKGGGLNKILSRVEALRGTVEITSSIKGGCELTVIIPGITMGMDNHSLSRNREQKA